MDMPVIPDPVNEHGKVLQSLPKTLRCHTSVSDVRIPFGSIIENVGGAQEKSYQMLNVSISGSGHSRHRQCKSFPCSLGTRPSVTSMLSRSGCARKDLRSVRQDQAYQKLCGGARPLSPELGIVADWVGLEEPAIAASPLGSQKGLQWGNRPVVDPGKVQGAGQEGAAWREVLGDHDVCLVSLQQPHHAWYHGGSACP